MTKREKIIVNIALEMPLDVHTKYRVKKLKDGDKRTLKEIYRDILIANLKGGR